MWPCQVTCSRNIKLLCSGHFCKCQRLFKNAEGVPQIPLGSLPNRLKEEVQRNILHGNLLCRPELHLHKRLRLLPISLSKQVLPLLSSPTVRSCSKSKHRTKFDDARGNHLGVLPLADVRKRIHCEGSGVEAVTDPFHQHRPALAQCILCQPMLPELLSTDTIVSSAAALVRKVLHGVCINSCIKLTLVYEHDLCCLTHEDTDDSPLAAFTPSLALSMAVGRCTSQKCRAFAAYGCSTLLSSLE